MTPLQKTLASALARNWWILLLRGLLAIAFGVLAWTRPDLTVATLVLLFGAFAISDGILAIWFAIAEREDIEHWVLMLIGGLLGIALGVLTFTYPQITGLVLLFYIAIMYIVTGVIQIVMGIRLRKEMEGEWFLILGGVAGIVFGGILISRPLAGALALIWVIGSYAVFFGILFVIQSFRLRKLKPAEG